MTFLNTQINISDIEMIDSYSFRRFHEMDGSIPAKEIEILEENPWILLKACNMHFYDFIFSNEGKNNDVIGTMFFLEEEIEDICLVVKKIFRTSLFFRTITEPNNQLVYKVDVNGITEFGETALKLLNLRGAIPVIWKELYLTESYPLIEDEGIYFFDDPHIIQENYFEDTLSKLLINPFFNAMDISNVPLMYCEEDGLVQEILRRCKDAFVVVEEHHAQYLKTICWEI